MALCNFCGKLSFERLYREEYRHQPTFKALHRSAEAGCTLCTLLYQTLSRRFKEQGIIPEEDNADTQIWIERYPYEMSELFGTEQELRCRAGVKEDMMHAGLKMVTSSDDPAADYIKARPIRHNPTDDELFELIQQWLYECTNDHPHPCCHAKSTALPSRILDVGPADGSQEPFLFESRGRTGKYLTLSYCWGSSENARTLEGNFEAYLREIKYASLPKTIRDAIDITRKLGFPYLWVDSLCIIQDSPKGQDWEIESPKMAEVYGNSFLTIAAESASDCSQGIFFNRSPRVGVNVPFFLDGGLRCGSVTLHDQWDYVSPPLQSRGWTFQEQELSRRLLSYGTEMLHYRCRHTDASEELGLSNTTTAMAKFMKLLVPPKPQFEEMILEDALLYWYDCIKNYSQRILTYETDKLPAISGIAHKLENAIKSSYQAGLWECDLVYGLLWQTQYRAPRTAVVSTRRPWRAPSWSWASLDVGISWDIFPPSSLRRQTQRPRVLIITAKTDLLQKDPMGQVSGGTLTLEGCLKAAKWVPKASITSLPQKVHLSLLQYNEILLETAYSNAGNAATGQSKPSQHNEPPDSASSWPSRMFAVCRFDDDVDCPPNVWCLLLTSERGPADKLELDDIDDASQVQIPDEWKSEQEEWERSLRELEESEREQPSATGVHEPADPSPIEQVTSSGRGIMLVPTDSGTLNEYRRVGYFELEGELDDWPTDLIKITIV